MASRKKYSAKVRACLLLMRITSDKMQTTDVDEIIPAFRSLVEEYNSFLPPSWEDYQMILGKALDLKVDYTDAFYQFGMEIYVEWRAKGGMYTGDKKRIRMLIELLGGPKF